MQYLVEGKDKALTVLYQRSIIVEDTNASLSIGEAVKFLWPEESSSAKEYSGVIIAKDRNEDVLINQMESLKAKIQPKSFRTKKATKKPSNILKDASKNYENVDDDIKVKVPRRKRPATVLEKEILTNFKISDIPESTLTLDSPHQFDWVTDEISSLKNNIESDLTSVKEKIFSKLNFLQTSLIPHTNISSHGQYTSPLDKSELNVEDVFPVPGSSSEKLESKKRNRSFGMPSNLEIVEPVLAKKRSRSFGMSVDLSDADSSIDINSSDEEQLDKKKTKKSKFVVSSSEDEGEQSNESGNNGNSKNADSVKNIKQEDCEIRDLIEVEANKINIEGKIEDTDNTDTKWTLKYLKPTDNVVELFKDCGIYVNKIDKNTVKAKSKNQNEMARALTKSVFTEIALKKCSLYGSKSKGNGKTDIVRPGLNKDGVEAILVYVQAYAQKHNWPLKDRLLIIRSMSSKLNEMKA